MVGAFDRIGGLLLLDDAWFPSVRARWQRHGDDVREQLPIAPPLLRRCAGLQIGYRFANHPQRSQETEAGGRERDRRGGVCHHGTHDVMGDQQGVDLLNDADGFLAAQRGLRSLMGLDFVHRHLPLPAGMVRLDEHLRRSMPGIKQRGEQAMLDAVSGGGGIIEGVANQAEEALFPASSSWAVGGLDNDEVRAVGEGGLHGRMRPGGQASEQIGVARTHGGEEGETVELAIPQEEVARPDAAHQRATDARRTGGAAAECGVEGAWVAHSIRATTRSPQRKASGVAAVASGRQT